MTANGVEWHPGIAIVALLAALCCAAAPRAARADDSPPPPSAADDADPAVQSGRDALRNPDRFPWYDSQNDKLRRVELRRVTEQNYSKRKPDDADHPWHPHRAVGRHGNMHGSQGNGDGNGNGDGSGNANGDGTGDQDGASSGGGDNSTPPRDDSSPPPPPMPVADGAGLLWLAWLAIGGVLVALAVMLIRAFLNREARAAKESAAEQSEAEEDEQRLDALPAGPVRARDGLLEEARRQYEAGNYREAIIYLYSYQLMKLDQNQWIRLAKGKTNREYLRELAGRPELQSLLARTMTPFEDVFFGDYPLDQPRFEACWREVDRFHRLIQQAVA